ncbi:DUF4126 family protein [Pontibacter oryzae]|uniref:DUF4126 family protein n=1 Tax=Pontibacter oryzae TaxID=2304593 RepID=A0A399SDY4_9BACT|nr:DUF4126 family protein [Pontibacter oryzae]RIJ41421.1 DUF4126 family protein [Pontibacter oryzae]
MKKILYKTLALGALAGLRSLSAPALLSRNLSSRNEGLLQNTPLHLLENKTVATVLSGLSATELLGDKLPGIPDRIELPSLLFRGASGALVGAAIYLSDRKNAAEGAALGALGAVAATYASFYLRKSLGKATGIADPVFGALEDALVVSSGLQVAKM